MATARIIDAHAHVFPDEATGRAWQAYVGIPEPRRSGAIDELRRLMARGGIEHTVMLLIPRAWEIYNQLVEESRGTRSEEEICEQVCQEIKGLNRWGCEAASRDRRFIPFISINPRFMSAAVMRDEIDAMVQAGARGVKMIPPSMRRYVNDPSLFPVYQRCQELGLPILSQSGTGGGPPPSPGADHFGRPKYFEEVLSSFPGLTVILAHLGHGYEDDVIRLTSTFPNIYTDTSLQLSGLGKPGRPTPGDLADLIRRIGVDRVLLGSNYPMVDPAVYVQVLSQLPLTEEEHRKIAGENFQRIIAL